MSVINKVLRDLDQRQAQPEGAADLRQGTVSVPGHPLTAKPAASAPRRPAWLLPLSLTVLLAAAGGWAAWQGLARQPAVPAVPAAAAAASAPAVVAAPVPVPQEAPPPAPAASVAAPKPAPAAPAAPVVAAAKPRPAVSDTGLRMAIALDTRKLKAAEPAPAAPEAKPLRASPASEPAPVAARAPAGAGEVLAQAQQLWASGAHDAGVDLLQQALARANAAEAQAVLRELARMQMADGRVNYVWGLLVQHEARLTDAADLWAIRANAAQRLGQYQDSAGSYAKALQLKPAEQRWLLGAAVSHAALGQTQQATDYLNQARAVGPVAADVLAYLKQMGVSAAP